MILRRMRNLWRSRSLDEEFDAELAFDREKRIEAHRRAGMSAQEAELAARRQFGSLLRAREGMREARSAAWIPAFGRDVKVAARMLRRQPLLAVLAVLTLSLGIGATAAVCAFVYGMLIRPLPYADADHLVAIIDTFHIGPPRTSPTVPELLDLRAATTTLSALSFADSRDFEIGGGTEPARVVGGRVEPSFLAAFGVRPALGRLFTDGDAVEDAPPVAILSNDFWRRNFGADASIVGRSVRINGRATEIVGILPRSYHFDFYAPGAIEVYVPFPMVPVYTAREAAFVNVRRVMAIGKLKPGETLAHAAAEVQTVAARIAAAHPELYRQGSDRRDVGFAMQVEALQEYLFAGGRPTARLLLIATMSLLLLGCFNMAQVLFARALDRRGELGMRSAIGATRGRLWAQLIAESLMLATVTTVTALFLAAGFVALLRLNVAEQDPFLADRVALAAPVIALTITIAAVVTMACHMLPVLRLAHWSPLNVLATDAVAPKTRLQHLLIAAQVGVTVMLLGVTTLLVYSLTRLESGDRGYTAEAVTTIRLRAPLRVQGVGLPLLYRNYLDRLQLLPEIVDVAMTGCLLPMFQETTFAIDDRETDAGTLSRQQSGYCIVSPTFFSTLRIPLRAGRTFADSDGADTEAVAVVNEELARRAWPGQQAVGRRIRAGEGPRAASMVVIGVVGDVRPAMQLEPIPQVYVSYQQQPEPNMRLLVRPRAGTRLPLAAIKTAVWSVAPDQPLFDVRPLPDVITMATAEPRRSLALLLGTISILAVVVSGAGLFTLITYVTTRRRREIALRRVIGAGVGDVIRTLLAPTMRWTCLGLLVGAIGAAAVGGVLRSTYAGVAPTEPRLLVAIGAAYLVLAAAAMCAPMISALRRDPATILRAE